MVAALAFTAVSVSALDAALGYGLVAVLVAAVAAPQLSAMWRGRIDLKGHGPRPRPYTAPAHAHDIPSAAQLAAQAWAYGLAAVLYPIFFQISTVLLKYLGSNAQAGRYGVALAIMTAIYLLPATIYQKFLLSRLHRWAVHDKPKFWRVYHLGNRCMLAAGMVVGLGLAAIAPRLVHAAFGTAYSGVATVLIVLAICTPIRFLSTSVGSVLLTEHHMRYRVLAMLAATAAAVGLNAVLIPHYGELGAAWATVAAESLLLLSMWLGAHRLIARETRP